MITYIDMNVERHRTYHRLRKKVSIEWNQTLNRIDLYYLNRKEAELLFYFKLNSPTP